jgi:hypothetical protein
MGPGSGRRPPELARVGRAAADMAAATGYRVTEAWLPRHRVPASGIRGGRLAGWPARAREVRRHFFAHAAAAAWAGRTS